MIRLLLADDHQVLLDGLQLLLKNEADMQVVAVAKNGKQALDVLKKSEVDVALLDINLPVLNGIETCRRIKKDFPRVAVLALTSYDKGAFIQQMLKAGAAGYVLKNAAADEIVQAIRTVHAGETYLSPSVSTTLLNTLRNQADAQEDFIPQLTRREQQVLQLIAAEQTTKEIAEQLHLSQNTIETHRRNLLSKLNVRNVAGLIKVALQRGLID